MATDITAVVLEVLVAGTDDLAITAVVLEALVATPDDTGLSGVTLEVLSAEDIASTHIGGVTLEILSNADKIGIAGVVLEVLSAPDLVVSEFAIEGVTIEVLVGLLREPEDAPVSRYTDIDEAKIGRDLVLPGLGGHDPVPPTLTGDWPSLAGRPNLHAAVRRRLVTAPGQLIHRPEYGGGLPLFVGVISSPSERARLAAGARQNLLRDPRIGTVQVGVGEPPGMPGVVLVEAAVQPIGETGTDTVSVVQS